MVKHSALLFALIDFKAQQAYIRRNNFSPSSNLKQLVRTHILGGRSQSLLKIVLCNLVLSKET